MRKRHASQYANFGSLRKVYDSSKKYKMAIVCSSSKAGDSFKGAVNSTLFVDELEIIGE